jgi:hypothetical protein
MCVFDYSIWVQLLDRRQQRLELVLLSIDNFTEPPPNIYNVENNLNPPMPAVQVIYTQHTDIWINVSLYRNVNGFTLILIFLHLHFTLMALLEIL